MAISWDENQLPSLSAWVEGKLPLKHGDVAMSSMDIPANCFAGEYDLIEKEFVVFTNIESPMADVTINMLLGYIIALAFDESNWESIPSHEILFDAHSRVCNALLEFNEDVSRALEEQADVLEAWHQTNAADGSTTTSIDAEDLVTSMGSALFTANPSDTKNYGAN